MWGKTPKRLKILPFSVILSIEEDSYGWAALDPSSQRNCIQERPCFSFPLLISLLISSTSFEPLMWLLRVAREKLFTITLSLFALLCHICFGLRKVSFSPWIKISSGWRLKTSFCTNKLFFRIRAIKLQSHTCIIWFFKGFIKFWVRFKYHKVAKFQTQLVSYQYYRNYICVPLLSSTICNAKEMWCS